MRCTTLYSFALHTCPMDFFGVVTMRGVTGSLRIN